MIASWKQCFNLICVWTNSLFSQQYFHSVAKVMNHRVELVKQQKCRCYDSVAQGWLDYVLKHVTRILFLKTRNSRKLESIGQWKFSAVRQILWQVWEAEEKRMQDKNKHTSSLANMYQYLEIWYPSNLLYGHWLNQISACTMRNSIFSEYRLAVKIGHFFAF